MTACADRFSTNTKFLGLLIPIVIILPFLYLRLTRMMKPRRLKPKSLWVRPAMISAAASVWVAASPPRAADLIWLISAATIGIGGGWYWGKLTQLHLNPEDGALMSKASMAGMIVLPLLMLVRLGIRAGIQLEARAMGLNEAMLTDDLIVFTAALFSTQGLEVYLRAERLEKQQA